MRSFSDFVKGIIHRGLENIVGRYYSSYRAFVHSVDDPKYLNRIQLLVPHVNPNVPDETWAWPKNNFSGNGYGMHILPKKGDLVWVEYEYGNLDYPIWSFGHYAENEKPSEFRGNSMYGFKTPRGTTITINDVKGKEYIAIKLAGLNDTLNIKLDEIELESKLIKIGKDSSEWASKGESTQAKIEELWEAISLLNQTLATHGHGGNGASPPFQASTFTQGVTDANNKKQKVKEILSKKIKLE